MRLLLYRDLAGANAVPRGSVVAKVEAAPIDHIEMANLVMRTLVPFDFNLWMPPDRAVEVAATMRRLMPGNGPSA